MNSLVELKKLEYPYNFLLFLDEPFSEIKNISVNQLEGLNYVLSQLPQRNQSLVYMYFKEKKSLDSCAKVLNVTHVRVRQILFKIRRFIVTPNSYYRGCICEGIQRKKELETTSNLYDIPLTYLNLSSRCYNSLARGGFLWNNGTVGALLESIYSDIYWYKKCRTMGKRSVSAVYFALLKKKYVNKNLLQNLVECGLYTQEELQELIKKEFN